MCAIDAIGIYYTTSLNILILSEDELTKEKIKLEIKDNKIINHNKSNIYISYKDVCQKKIVTKIAVLTYTFSQAKITPKTI